MTDNSTGEQLIQELLANPTRFYDGGKTYELLQVYFGGFPLATLRPLLADSETVVKRAAVWVTSELGDDGRSLIQDVIPLIRDDDRFIQYYALEIVAVCSVGEDVDEFVHVVRSMQDHDQVIRVLAMRLVSNAAVSQLKAATRLLRSNEPSELLHERGLSDLLRRDLLDPQEVLQMIDDRDPLVRKYGAIAAKGLFYKAPEVMATAASCADPDIRNFIQQIVR